MVPIHNSSTCRQKTAPGCFWPILVLLGYQPGLCTAASLASGSYSCTGVLARALPGSPASWTDVSSFLDLSSSGSLIALPKEKQSCHSMEPSGGLEALQGTLRLLVGLLALCLALLFLLNWLLVLRWRLAWLKGTGKMHSQVAPMSPPLLQVIPSGAVTRCGKREVVAKPLCTPAAGLLTSPLPGGAAGPCSWREPLGPRPPICSQGTAFSSSNLNRHPVLVPPNSPVTTTGSCGILGRGFSSCHTSTQSKLRSCSRTVWPSHVHLAPFEYGSSIQRNDERTGLNSANVTASQGPGLDSNFGASAGISVRILSSDSEESPSGGQPPPQHLGQFEWDYYDPGYKRTTHLPQQLPQICSKQYWL